MVKKEVLFTIQTPNVFFYIKEIPIVNGMPISSDSSYYNSTNYRRVDETTGVIKSYKQSRGESDWINLMMNVGEVEEKGSDTGYWKREVKNEEETEILEIPTSVKTYYTQDDFQGYTHEFAKDIGLIRYQLNGEYDRYNLILRGAKIGDVVIGDTTMTD